MLRSLPSATDETPTARETRPGPLPGCGQLAAHGGCHLRWHKARLLPAKVVAVSLSDSLGG
jgi:hypothetical protein